MATIATNIILIWTGTNASIPGGWSRQTTLDGKYPKATADGTNPNQTGGNSTHSHSSSAHSHSMSSHTHIFNLPYSGGDGNDSDSGGTELTANHYHAASVSGLSDGGLSSVTSTYASISNDPPYYKVIFIKADSPTLVPSQAVGLWSNESEIAS